MVIAAGTTRRPSVGLAVGAGVEVVAVEFVEVGTPEAQFGGSRACRQSLGAMLGQYSPIAIPAQALFIVLERPVIM